MTKSAFVLMPFEEPFYSYYSKVFYPALLSCGYTAEKADDIFSPTAIMSDIREKIRTSDIIFCEMTGKNPNVFYELGLAHAIGKPVVLVSQKEEDIPFDMRHIRILMYQTTAPDWAEKLKADILSSVQQIERGNFYREPLIDINTVMMNPHRDMRLIKSRQEVVNLLARMLDFAKAGECIIGSCNTCTDYPPDFYTAIQRALERGVDVTCIVRESNDAKVFIDRMIEFKNDFPNNMHLYKSSNNYIRAFILRSKQTLIAFPFEDSFVGVYFTDSRITEYFEITMNTIRDTANEVE